MPSSDELAGLLGSVADEAAIPVAVHTLHRLLDDADRAKLLETAAMAFLQALDVVQECIYCMDGGVPGTPGPCDQHDRAYTTTLHQLRVAVAKSTAVG